jgi:hypothetical protein
LTLYYIVKTNLGYAILHMTIEDMAKRAAADPLFAKSLDRAPFKTRGEAEQRLAELVSGLETFAPKRRPSNSATTRNLGRS